MNNNVRGRAVWAWVESWRAEETAVTAIEYALIAALIAVVIVGSVAAVGSELNQTYLYVSNCVKNLSCQ